MPEEEMKCIVKNCRNASYLKGFCPMHYMRNYRYGEPGEAARRRRHNGEGSITARGYLKYYRNGRRVQAHREIMEQFLGRKLRRNEDVHHKNGDTLDNRVGNLEIITHANHSSLHHKGRSDIALKGWKTKRARRRK